MQIGVPVCLFGWQVAVVLTDAGGKEITVRLVHAHESAEICRGLDALEGYELHDLVMLPLGVVGVVSHVGVDDLEVLTTRGERRRARPAEIARKLNDESRRNVSLDARDEHVRVDDVVTVKEGPMKGDDATVIRGYRASLWLQSSNSRAANVRDGGLFVLRARQCCVAGASAAGGSLADTYMGLGQRRTVDEAQFNASGASSAGGGGGARGAASLRGPAKDPLISRTVRVCKGEYKGLTGIATNATATHVTVELHTRTRSVTLKRERVKLVEGVEGGEHARVAQRAAEGAGYAAEALATPFLTESTPMLSGGATPQHGAHTPRHGYGQTPLRPGATPQHGQQTPGYSYGSQTPAHNNSTPGYSYGGETPNHNPGGNVADATEYNRGRDNAKADSLHDVWRPKAKQSLAQDEEDVPDQQGSTDAERAAAADEAADSDQAPAWCVEGAEVLSSEGKLCRVDKLLGREVSVTFKATRQQHALTWDELRRLAPQPKDLVRVTDAGQTYDATLLSIEENDGIIKLDSNAEYKIIDIEAIAKRAMQADYD